MVVRHILQVETDRRTKLCEVPWQGWSVSTGSVVYSTWKPGPWFVAHFKRRSRICKVDQPKEEPLMKHALTGRPCLFDTLWYPELMSMSTESLDNNGFGVETIQICATQIYSEKLSLSTEEASWYTTSDNWCYWFMWQKMGLSMRKQWPVPWVQKHEWNKTSCMKSHYSELPFCSTKVWNPSLSLDLTSSEFFCSLKVSTGGRKLDPKKLSLYGRERRSQTVHWRYHTQYGRGCCGCTPNLGWEVIFDSTWWHSSTQIPIYQIFSLSQPLGQSHNQNWVR